jgi:hypothetical protein
VGVFVFVAVRVLVGVFVFVAVRVLVGVFVFVAVRVLVGVFVFVAVRVLVGVFVKVSVLVGVVVRVGVGVGVSVLVGVFVCVAVRVEVGVLVLVGVNVAGLEATILKHQPPARIPISPGVISITYKLHVPLGSVPLKVASVVALEGVGAGAGKVSALPYFAGRYVPLDNAVLSGKARVALSSSVRLIW